MLQPRDGLGEGTRQLEEGIPGPRNRGRLSRIMRLTLQARGHAPPRDSTPEPVLDPLLRPVKDRALLPLAKALAGVGPGTVTAVAFAFGVAAAAAAWRGGLRLAAALWLANRVLDGLDGAVARVYGKSSDLGGFLDLVADFAVYAAIPLALAFRPGADPALPGAAAFLLGVFYVNAAAWMVPSALLERRGRGPNERGEATSVVIPEGLISGAETVLFYTLFFLLPDHQVLLFLVMAALTAITVAQRVVWATSKFRGPQGPRPSQA